MPKEKINVVWLKRDLRLFDHEPISIAIDKGVSVLILYLFEPEIMSLPQSSERHWRFIYESLTEINDELTLLGKSISILYGSAESVFNELVEIYEIQGVYSHHEVGLRTTSIRNKVINELLISKQIPWLEISTDGIQINIQNRNNWEEERNVYLESSLIQPNLQQLKTVELSEFLIQKYTLDALPESIKISNSNFQQGGRNIGRALLDSFLEQRHLHYIKHISQSTLSFETCSRLSPYLAYGCLSVREVYQKIQESLTEFHSDDLEAFLLRLFWRSHYMQKLDSEWELEFEPTNRALSVLDREYEEELYQAWATGKTGYPYIDATIRCLEATGYANFRMRSTLVTFATFTLWQDWKRVATHLASLFLDFEPGIHYGQIQLQAGLTGYHLIRIFSPSAQSNKHDKDRAFVKKWLPELKDIPNHLIPKPWMMTEEEQGKYHCEIGKDYPYPIAAFEISSTLAKAHYWKSRQRQSVFDHLPAIFKKHSLPQDIPNYMQALKLNMEEYKRAKKRLERK